MILPKQDKQNEFGALRLKPEALIALGVPVTEYHLRSSDLDRIICEGGQIGVTDLIRGLMDWLDVTDEPAHALELLRTIMDTHFPPDRQSSGSCEFVSEHGHRHRFHVGPVDLAGPCLAWQRREWMLAYAGRCDAEPRRLVVAAPGPISLATAHSIYNHTTPVDMGEPADCFARALTSGGRFGTFYSWEAGTLTIIPYANGFDDERNCSALQNGRIVPPVDQNRMAPNQIAAQVAIGNGFA